MSLLEGKSYRLEFPKGDVSEAELVKINSGMLGADYIFNPLAEKDRVFSAREEYQVLDWPSKWCFALPGFAVEATKITEITQDQDQGVIIRRRQ